MPERGESTNYHIPNPQPVDMDWFRNSPFEVLVQPNIDYSTGERKLLGVTVDDRLYGRFDFNNSVPGDSAIIEILYSEALNRLYFVNQLVLPHEFTTRPETSDFSRYEHSIGVMLLTRMLGGDSKQQLRALVHDMAQTAFSHLGDWRKQGMGGADDYHDLVQADYLRRWGIDEILERHGISFEEVTDKSIVDFVERPGPDLCVDRVDYALREFARWTCPGEVPYLISQLEVRDDMIVVKSHEAARVFGDYYLDLIWKHWAEPLHATKEKLFLLMIERAHEVGILKEEDMYGVDPILMTRLQMANDPAINELEWLLSDPSLDYIHERGLGFRDEHLSSPEDRLYVPMRDFKKRWVDPSFVRSDGTVAKLSERDSEYEEFLRIHFDMSDEHMPGFAKRLGIEGEWRSFVAIKVEPAVKQILSELIPELL